MTDETTPTLEEVAVMWAKLGRAIASIIDEASEWIDTNTQAETAITFADAAERCMRRSIELREKQP